MGLKRFKPAILTPSSIIHSIFIVILTASLSAFAGDIKGNNQRSTNSESFLKNVLAELDNSQYDGIDLDIEPFRYSGSVNDTTSVGPFIRRLYDSLQVRKQFADPSKKPLLTAAILPGWAGQWHVKHEYMFDQINIMTYDMAQSMGWGVDRTWHNNAVFSPPPAVGTNLYYTSIQYRWIQQKIGR